MQATGAFYFDLASPHCYLVAERILHELPGVAVWEPVLASDLPAAGSRKADTDALRGDVAERVRELGLQPLRWPEPFPFDSTLAMRAASYAAQIGRAVAFAQAAFRQAFAGGRSLAETDSVLIAAAACEMHPAAVLRALEMRSVAEQLKRTTDGASAAGVRALPAIALASGRLFQGAGALSEALASGTPA